jgi:hypothetical protein
MDAPLTDVSTFPTGYMAAHGSVFYMPLHVVCCSNRDGHLDQPQVMPEASSVLAACPQSGRDLDRAARP